MQYVESHGRDGIYYMSHCYFIQILFEGDFVQMFQVVVGFAGPFTGALVNDIVACILRPKRHFVLRWCNLSSFFSYDYDDWFVRVEPLATVYVHILYESFGVV